MVETAESLRGKKRPERLFPSVVYSILFALQTPVVWCRSLSVTAENECINDRKENHSSAGDARTHRIMARRVTF